MLINQSVNNDEQLDAIFAALADPTRRSIIVRLSQGSASVNEIAVAYDMSLPAVSKHLKVLEQAGLISKSVNAQRRECHLEAGQLQTATEWLGNYRQFWEGNFDRLDDYIKQINKEV